jgi:bifunctional DNase/RNase
VVHALQASLTQVRITELRDEIFFAELVFGDGTTVSARPSDAIALALRTDAPIFADDAVLDANGITIEDAGTEGGEIFTAVAGQEGQERAVEEFREFLDTISPEDFGAGPGQTPSS